MSKIVVTAALTGPIAMKSDNPGLPVARQEIAAAAAEAYAVGATVAHVHVRDPHEQPSADVDIAREAIERIHDTSPILVQLSTGVGPGVPLEQRARLVELRPRMASLNPCSMTFGNVEFSNPPEGVKRLAARMQELGVKRSWRCMIPATSSTRCICSKKAFWSSRCSSPSSWECGAA